MFGSKSVSAKDVGKAARSGDSGSFLSDLNLPESMRLDRYGRSLAGSMPDLVRRLPSADDARDARDSLLSSAQRALHALPDMSVSRPKRRSRRRGGVLKVALVVGAAAGAFFLYRRFARRDSDDLEWSSDPVNSEWPATPSTGDLKQAAESDAQAEVDAEQSAAVLDPALSPATAPAGGNGAQALT